MKKFLLSRDIKSSRLIEAEDWDAASNQLIAFQQEPVVEPDAVIEGTIEYVGECDAGTGVACESCRYDADDGGVLTQAVIDAAKEWVRANAALRQELMNTIEGSPTDEASALREFKSAQTSLIYAVEQLDE